MVLLIVLILQSAWFQSARAKEEEGQVVAGLHMGSWRLQPRSAAQEASSSTSESFTLWAPAPQDGSRPPAKSAAFMHFCLLLLTVSKIVPLQDSATAALGMFCIVLPCIHHPPAHMVEIFSIYCSLFHRFGCLRNFQHSCD
jgi:hypothetical protein